MGIAITRQRPSWGTQFGRSILQMIPQFAANVGNMAIQNAIRNYYAGQQFHRRAELSRELQNANFDFRRTQAEAAREQNAKMAEQARQARALGAVALRLMGTANPAVVGEGVNLAMAGRRYRSPLDIRRAQAPTGARVMQGYQSEPRPQAEVAADVGAYTRSLPPKTFEGAGRSQMSDAIKLERLRHENRLSEAEKKYLFRARLAGQAQYRRALREVELARAGAMSRAETQGPVTRWQATGQTAAAPYERAKQNILQGFRGRTRPSQKSILPTSQSESKYFNKIKEAYIRAGHSPADAETAARKLIEQSTEEQLQAMTQ